MFAEEEPDLYSVHTRPKTGIGQRAFLVRTPEGNVLWDCVPLLDGATIREVNRLGGLAAIAVSHPHYYTTMVEWSHAFGRVPVHIHALDAQWVMRPDEVVQFWECDRLALQRVRAAKNDGVVVWPRPDNLMVSPENPPERSSCASPESRSC